MESLSNLIGAERVSKCKSFFYKNKPPNGFGDVHGTSACICQTYGNTRYFATHYSKTYRIPIYSAYRLDSFSCPANQPTRRSKWFIEPQLYSSGHSKNMELAGGNTHFYQASQAINKDYPNTGYDRGHLNPNFYQCNDGRTATFTLTNSVPQKPCFNQKSWKKMEEAAKTLMSTKCTFPGAMRYFVTGAVPSNEWIPNEQNDNEGDQQRDYKRVSIPSVLWTAACCDSSKATRTDDRKKGFSFAYYGDNVPDSLVRPSTVNGLERTLVGLYRVQDVDIFTDGCFKTSTTSKEALAYLAVPVDQNIGNLMNYIGKSQESSMTPAKRSYLKIISSALKKYSSFARNKWRVNSAQFGILAKRSAHQGIRKTIAKRKLCTMLKIPAKLLNKAINKPPRDELRSLKVQARNTDETQETLNDDRSKSFDGEDATLSARDIDEIEETFTDDSGPSLDGDDGTLSARDIDEIEETLKNAKGKSVDGDDDTLSARDIDEIEDTLKNARSKFFDGEDDTLSVRDIDEIEETLKGARGQSFDGDDDTLSARDIDEIENTLMGARSTSFDGDDDILSANSDDTVDETMLTKRSTTQQNTANEDKYIVVLANDPRISANGDRCRSNHACDYHKKKYKWCYTDWSNNWDYCCTGSCDFHKSTYYQYCTSGNTWAYCSQRSSMVTVSNKQCRPDHECATHGYKVYWCYTDTNQNWDYCCQPWHDCLKHKYSYNWCYTGYTKKSRSDKCYY